MVPLEGLLAIIRGTSLSWPHYADYIEPCPSGLYSDHFFYISQEAIDTRLNLLNHHLFCARLSRLFRLGC
jgi:hypothetical protein